MDDACPEVLVIEPNDTARAALTEALKGVAFCKVAASPVAPDAGQAVLALGEKIPGASAVMPKPCRIGEIMDKIRLLQAAGKETAGKSLPIGPHMLDRVLAVLVKDSGESVYLTEKECAILVVLSASSDPMSREMLLQRVWGYADGVETHTLETHIYRLRQKIEDDPSAPALLLTDEDGYRIVQ